MDSGVPRLPSAAVQRHFWGTDHADHPTTVHRLVSCNLVGRAAPASRTAQTVAVDNDDIGGTVNGPAGPEAGVWVIAETDDFDNALREDRRHRRSRPFRRPRSAARELSGVGARLRARRLDEGRGPPRRKRWTSSRNAAPSPAAAAVVYPAAYWYSMMKVPDGERSQLAARRRQSSTSRRSRICRASAAIRSASSRRARCRRSSASLPSHHDAWVRRIQSGQAGSQMLASAMNQLGGVPPKYLADWTERVAKGELPHAQPQRPRGVERNIVATVRDWSTDKAYMHDLSGTDRRNPTVNALRQAVRRARAQRPTSSRSSIRRPTPRRAFHAPVQDPSTPTTNSTPPTQPSPYWGNEAIWDSKANAHNPMLDEKGRVWYTAVVRAPDNAPAYCSAGSDHPSAKAVPARALGPAALGLRSEDGEVHVHRHVLLDAPPAIRRGRERHAVDERRRPRRRLAELEDVPRDRRRRGSRKAGRALVLDTNGNGKRDELRRARSARRSGEGQTRQQRLLRRDAESGRRLDLGLDDRLSRRRRARRSRLESAGDGARRGLQRADAGLRRARRGHRPQRRRLGVARQRPLGRVRPAQVQRRR